MKLDVTLSELSDWKTRCNLTGLECIYTVNVNSGHLVVSRGPNTGVAPCLVCVPDGCSPHPLTPSWTERTEAGVYQLCMVAESSF